MLVDLQVETIVLRDKNSCNFQLILLCFPVVPGNLPVFSLVLLLEHVLLLYKHSQMDNQANFFDVSFLIFETDCISCTAMDNVKIQV